jgi:hypothetical protein
VLWHYRWNKALQLIMYIKESKKTLDIHTNCKRVLRKLRSVRSRVGNNTNTRVLMRRGKAPLSHCSAPAQKHCWHVRRRRKRSLCSGTQRHLGSCLPGAPVAASEASQRMLNVAKCSLAMQRNSSALRTTGATLCFCLALSGGTVGTKQKTEE